MKTTSGTIFTVGVVVALLLASPAFGLNAPQEEATFQGQLLQVDAEQQTILVGNPDGEERMLFLYSADTEVVGNIEDVQGLAEQAGSQLSITYVAQGETMVATRIEVRNPEP
jgi:hypothetical protein